MKKRNVVFLLALVGAAYLALKRKKQADLPAEPVVHLVQEVLHKHEGEDSPIVHAFEEALEHKAAHGDVPA